MDDLLARGTLGGPKYDEILQRVLDQTATDGGWWTKRRIRFALLPSGAMAAAVAAWLVFARPATDGFAPKGGAVSAGALEIGCQSSGTRVCHAGDTLMVTVNSALTSGYLGAYAERTDDGSRERIWYFPDARGLSPMVHPGTGTVVVQGGVRIGAEHAPGSYRVTVWIAGRSLEPSEVDGAPAGIIRSRSTFELQVVP